jgi:hypothetical protein
VRVSKRKRLLFLVYVSLFSLSSCLPTQKIALSKSGDCPQVREFQRVIIEGYFDLGADQSVSIHGGYESSYPYAQFTFSAEPGAKSKFEAAVVWANQGQNGSEKVRKKQIGQNSRKAVVSGSGGSTISIGERSSLLRRSGLQASLSRLA